MRDISKLNEVILSVLIIVSSVSFFSTLLYFAHKSLYQECAAWEQKEVPVYISGVGRAYVKKDVCSYYKQPTKGK